MELLEVSQHDNRKWEAQSYTEPETKGTKVSLRKETS